MNTKPMKKYKIAVLDDYQNAALECADWSVLRDRADIAVFQNHLADPDAVIERLLPFDVVCVMRERTPLSRKVIERLAMQTTTARELYDQMLNLYPDWGNRGALWTSVRAVKP